MNSIFYKGIISNLNMRVSKSYFNSPHSRRTLDVRSITYPSYNIITIKPKNAENDGAQKMCNEPWPNQ